VKDPKYRKTVYDCVQKDLANAKRWLRRQRKNANYSIIIKKMYLRNGTCCGRPASEEESKEM
jgi:hypothetical protein